MAVQTLAEMFEYRLAETYGIEQELVGVLSEFASAASNESLETAFADHQSETETHVRRLDGVFDALGESPRQQASAAIDGVVTDRRQFVEQTQSREMRDLYNISAALLAERVEMTNYEELLTLAKQLDYDVAVVEPLEQNFEEDEAARTELKTLRGGSKIEAFVERLFE